jgi:hypothetical protein
MLIQNNFTGKPVLTNFWTFLKDNSTIQNFDAEGRHAVDNSSIFDSNFESKILLGKK